MAKAKMTLLKGSDITQKIAYRLKETNLNNEIQLKINQYIRTLEREVKKRIFDEGLNSDEVLIGMYSTNPIIVKDPIIEDKYKWADLSKATNKKFPLVLSGGYKEFRKIQDLKTDQIILDYTGQLKNSFKVSNYRKSAVAIGFADSYGSQLSAVHTKKYGDVFKLTYTEETIFTQYLFAHINAVVNADAHNKEIEAKRAKLRQTLESNGWKNIRLKI